MLAIQCRNEIVDIDPKAVTVIQEGSQYLPEGDNPDMLAGINLSMGATLICLSAPYQATRQRILDERENPGSTARLTI